MNPSELAWTLLTNAVGTYFGTGVNHKSEEFESSCTLAIEIPNKILTFKSKAKGMRGDIFHEELSWIGRDFKGVLTLFVNSNNHPGITAHSFFRIEEQLDGSKKIIFRFGNPSELNSFREDITFTILKNYNFEHSYSWGLPGKEFSIRSVSKFKKIIDQNHDFLGAADKV